MHSIVCDKIRCLKEEKKEPTSTIGLTGVLSIVAQEYQSEFSVA